MFTGLIEEVGEIRSIRMGADSAEITCGATRVTEDLHLGDSVAVNGACLTVTRFDASHFSVEAVKETLRRSNLGKLTVGSPVNLERALRLSDRLGGHIVAGHVDGVGRLLRRASEGIADVLTIEAGPALMRYVVEKGSICVDGVSLTVMDTGDSWFRVSIIPHTSGHTTLQLLREGQELNLETDVLAKYVERLLYPAHGSEPLEQRASTVDLEFLRKHGFA